MTKPARKPTSYDKFRTEELAKIHIARKELNLSDDIYRDIVRVASGGKTESSANLDWRGRSAVLERFKELGWKKQPSKKAFKEAFPKAQRPEPSARRLADDPQSVMLRALWIQLHQAGKVSDSSEAALCKFVKRMTKKDALQWLSDRDVTVVKKALKDWLERP